jgi:hypothetical protein
MTDRPCGLCKGMKVVTRPTKIPQSHNRIRKGLWWITETCEACNGSGIKTPKGPIE